MRRTSMERQIYDDIIILQQKQALTLLMLLKMAFKMKKRVYWKQYGPAGEAWSPTPTESFMSC